MSRWPSVADLVSAAHPSQRAEIERAAAQLGRGTTTPAQRRLLKRARPELASLEEPNLPWSFTILGAPRTKNTGKSPRPGIVIPSAAYRRWFHAAMEQLPVIRRDCRGTATVPVDVTAVFFRVRDQGDEDRFCIALGDWLQRAGLVLNDSLIHWTGDTRRELDRARPRIEVCVAAAVGVSRAG